MNKKVITAYIHQLVNKYIIHLTLPIWIAARCGVFEEKKNL